MKKINLIFFILLCVLLAGCEYSKNKESVQGFAMDASYSIQADKMPDDKKDEIKTYLKTVDLIFDAYQNESLIGKLNIEKQLNITDEKSRELYQIIQKSLLYCNEWFDISIRPVSKLWNFHSENKALPEQKDIVSALSAIDYRNIVLNEEQIILKNGAEVELGAVAKGYVCDKISEMLSGSAAIIDIGGTVKAVGETITVGVKSPTQDGILCSLELPAGMAISTSGSYERYVEINGKRYHHILNPATGYPVDSKFLEVSVISDSALLCDVYSTTYFAENKLQTKSGIEAIFVTEDYEIFLTSGIKNFQLYKNNYTVKSIELE